MRLVAEFPLRCSSHHTARVERHDATVGPDTWSLVLALDGTVDEDSRVALDRYQASEYLSAALRDGYCVDGHVKAGAG